MEKNYKQILNWLLEHEGGYDDDPADSGGPTRFGVTIYDVATREGVPHSRLARGNAVWNQLREKVKALTLDQAGEIYRVKYWQIVRGSELPSGVDYTTFDFGVNSGTSRAIKYLQRAVSVTDDGVLGPVTMKAVIAANPSAVIRYVCQRRQSFLEGLSTFSRFGRGWTRRVQDVLARSLKLV